MTLSVVRISNTHTEIARGWGKSSRNSITSLETANVSHEKDIEKIAFLTNEAQVVLPQYFKVSFAKVRKVPQLLVTTQGNQSRQSILKCQRL